MDRQTSVKTLPSHRKAVKIIIARAYSIQLFNIAMVLVQRKLLVDGTPFKWNLSVWCILLQTAYVVTRKGSVFSSGSVHRVFQSYDALESYPMKQWDRVLAPSPSLGTTKVRNEVQWI